MNPMTTLREDVKIYRAPWGRALKWLSAAMVLVTVVLMLLPFFPQEKVPLWASQGAVGGMPLLLLACLMFTVRGYEITEDVVLVRRLFWKTRLPLAGLKSVEAIPRAMSKSLRTCGNGGIFSFTGWYWNRSLGSFHAYVTDLERTVVIRLAKRTVVISPENPAEFVRDLRGAVMKPESAVNENS